MPRTWAQGCDEVNQMQRGPLPKHSQRLNLGESSEPAEVSHTYTYTYSKYVLLSYNQAALANKGGGNRKLFGTHTGTQVTEQEGRWEAGMTREGEARPGPPPTAPRTWAQGCDEVNPLQQGPLPVLGRRPSLGEGSDRRGVQTATAQTQSKEERLAQDSRRTVRGAAGQPRSGFTNASPTQNRTRAKPYLRRPNLPTAGDTPGGGEFASRARNQARGLRSEKAQKRRKSERSAKRIFARKEHRATRAGGKDEEDRQHKGRSEQPSRPIGP